jgi:hypothetical protein
MDKKDSTRFSIFLINLLFFTALAYLQTSCFSVSVSEEGVYYKALSYNLSGSYRRGVLPVLLNSPKSESPTELPERETLIQYNQYGASIPEVYDRYRK